MPILAKTLSNLLAPAAGGTNVVTGVGFQPKIIIVYSARLTNQDTQNNRLGVSLGWAKSSTEQGHMTFGSADAVTPSFTNSRLASNGFMGHFLQNLTVFDGRISLTSLDADGFTYNTPLTFASDIDFNALCLGGSSLTNVACGNAAMPTGNGNFSVTGLGFKPDAIFILATGRAQTSINAEGLSTGFSFGFGTDAANQRSYGAAGQTAVDPTSNRDIISATKILSCPLPNSNGMDLECALVSMDADGFTLQKVNGGTGVATQYLWLALKGGSYKVVDMASKTDLTPTDYTPGITPAAIFGIGRPAKSAAETTPTNEIEFTIGSLTSLTDKASIWAIDIDAATGNTNTAMVQSFLGIALNWNKNLPNFIVGGITDITSFPTPVTLQQADADTSVMLFASLWIGEGGVLFHPLNLVTSDSLHGRLNESTPGSAPTEETTGTGWTVGLSAPTQYSKMAFGVERVIGTFSGTAPTTGPDNSIGDCFRTLTRKTGQFAAGDWSFSVSLKAVTAASGQDGRIRVRVYKGTNADGSGATEVTAGATLLSIVTNVSTSVAGLSTGTVSLPAVSLNNEYLFIQLAWQITGAAS